MTSIRRLSLAAGIVVIAMDLHVVARECGPLTICERVLAHALGLGPRAVEELPVRGGVASCDCIDANIPVKCFRRTGGTCTLYYKVCDDTGQPNVGLCFSGSNLNRRYPYIYYPQACGNVGCYFPWYSEICHVGWPYYCAPVNGG